MTFTCRGYASVRMFLRREFEPAASRAGEAGFDVTASYGPVVVPAAGGAAVVVGVVAAVVVVAVGVVVVAVGVVVVAAVDVGRVDRGGVVVAACDVEGL